MDCTQLCPLLMLLTYEDCSTFEATAVDGIYSVIPSKFYYQEVIATLFKLCESFLIFFNLLLFRSYPKSALEFIDLSNF